MINLDKTRLDLTDPRDPALSDHVETLTDDRQPELPKQVEQLSDERENALEDQVEEVPGTIEDKTLSDTVVDLGGTPEEHNLVGKESLINPGGDTSLDETLHTPGDSLQVIIDDSLDETLEDTRIDIEDGRENKLYTEPETLQPIGDDPNEVLEDTRLDLIDNRENKLHTEASSVDDPENRLGDTLDETLYTDTNSRGLDGNMIPDTLDETLHTKEDSRELEGNMIPDDPSETLEDYVDAMLADEVGHASQSLDVHNNMSNGDEWGGDKHAAWEGDRLYTGRANLLDNDEGHLTSSHDQYNNIADTFSGTDHKSWDGETLYDDNAKRLSDAGGGEFGDSDQLCDTIIDMLDDDRGHSSQSLDINNNMSEGDEYGGNEHKAWEGEGLYKGRSKVLSNDEGHSTSSLDSHNDITDTFSGNDHKSWDGSTLHKDNAKMLADDTSKVSDNGGDDKYLDTDVLGQGAHKQFNGDSLNQGKAKMLSNDENHATSSLDSENNITDTFSGNDHKSWDGATLHKDKAKVIANDESHQTSSLDNKNQIDDTFSGNAHASWDGFTLYKGKAKVISNDEDHLTSSLDNKNDVTDTFSGTDHKSWDGSTLHKDNAKLLANDESHSTNSLDQNNDINDLFSGNDHKSWDGSTLYKDNAKLLADNEGHSSPSLDSQNNMSAGDEWSGSHAEWEGDKLYTGKSKLLANDENHLTSSLDDKNQIEDTFSGTDHKSWNGETLYGGKAGMLANDESHLTSSLDGKNDIVDTFYGDDHASWDGETLYTDNAKLLENDENHQTSSLDDKNNITDTFAGNDHKSWDGATLYGDNAKRIEDKGGGEFGEDDQLYDTIIGMLEDDEGHASQSLDINNNMSEGDEYGGSEHKAWDGDDRLYTGKSKVLDNDESHLTSSLDAHNDIDDTFDGNDHKSWDGATLYKGRASMLADNTSNTSTNGGDDKYLDTDVLGQGAHKQFDGDSLNQGKAQMLVNDENHATSSLDQHNNITDTFSGTDHANWDGETLHKDTAKLLANDEDHATSSLDSENGITDTFSGEDHKSWDGNTLHKDTAKLLDNDENHQTSSLDDKNNITDDFSGTDHKSWSGILHTDKAKLLDNDESHLTSSLDDKNGIKDTFSGADHKSWDEATLYSGKATLLDNDESHATSSLDNKNQIEDTFSGNTHENWDGETLYSDSAKLLSNDEDHATSSLDKENGIDDTFSGTDHKSWDGTLYSGTAKRIEDKGGGEFGEDDQLYDTIIGMLEDDEGHASQSLDINNNLSEGDEYGSPEHKAWEGEKLYTGKSKVLDNDESHLTSSLDDKNNITDDFSGTDHKSWSGILHTDKAKLLADDTAKDRVGGEEDRALGTSEVVGDDSHRWDGSNIHSSSVDLTADDTTKDGARRISDLDSTLKAIMEARKSGDLNLYYTNVLKFAQGKTLNKGWGAKVSGLMSSYLVGDDISEGKAKEFEEALVKSVIQDDYSKNSVKLKNNNPREGWSKKVESLSTDTVDGIDYHLPGFNLMGNGLNPSAYLRWLAENTVGKVPVKGKWRQLMIDEALGLLVYARELAEKATKTNRDRLPGGEGLLGELAGGLMNGGVSGLAKAGAKAAAKAIFGGGDVDLTIPQNRPTKKEGQPGNKEKGKTVYTALNDKSESPTKGAMLGQDYEFKKNYIQDSGKFKGFVTTADEIIGKSAGSINTVEDLYASLRAAPYAITANKITSGEYNPLKVHTLDSNMYWEIIFTPFVGKENGNRSYLPPINEINIWNKVYHGVETGYGTWVPINGFELSKAKLTTKTLALFDGEINYPVSMEFTNELRLTFVDDQYKSWRTYFERCMDCSVYNSQIHNAADYGEGDRFDNLYDLSEYERKEDDDTAIGGIKSMTKGLLKKAAKSALMNGGSGKGLTAIDKKYQCVAPYKNITFRCTIYSLTPQLSTISKYDLLVVIKDFVEERSGEIDGDPGDLTVAFSIVGENPSADRKKPQIGDVEAMKKRQNKDKARNNTASIISSAANKVIGLL